MKQINTAKGQTADREAERAGLSGGGQEHLSWYHQPQCWRVHGTVVSGPVRLVLHSDPHSV